MGSESIDEQVEAAVRRYMRRIARRLMPGLATVALIVTVLVYAPGEADDTLASGNDLGRIGSLEPDGQGSGALPTTGRSGDVGGTGTSTASAGSPRTAGPGTSGGSPSAGGSGDGNAAPGAPGSVARSGVTCDGGARQVPWSSYAAPCTPIFTGDNGGETAPGVSADKIVVTYRVVSSAAGPAVRAAAGGALGGDPEEYIADLQAYFSLFNEEFETYGREVVLVPFQGEGDALEEAQGRGQAGAQADAATAKSLGAFADLTITPSALYAEGLADQGIISFGVPYQSQRWFDDRAPYAYSSWPANDRFAEFTGNMACQRMANQPAVFSSDPLVQSATRRFGIIVPENPVFAAAGDRIEQMLEACGSPAAARFDYQLDISRITDQAAQAMARMNSAQVTTILCACDPIGPIFFTQAADGQRYRPEWYTLWWGDTYGRLYDDDQWASAMSSNGTSPDLATTEAFRAYQLSGGSGPEAAAFDLPYLQTLQLFNGIQVAGPELTPVNFARGWFAQPPADGDIGPWGYGDFVFTPKSAFQVGYWDPNATSLDDGETGAWITCGGSGWIRYDDPSAFSPAGSQLACFGR